jgi:hypothetical protein
VEFTEVDKIIARLLREVEYRSAVCSNIEDALGPEIYGELSSEEEDLILMIACQDITLSDLEAGLNTINRTMGHFVTDH